MTTIPNTTGSAQTVQVIIDYAVDAVLSLHDEGADVPGVAGATGSGNTVRTIISNAVDAVLSLRGEGQVLSPLNATTVRTLIDAEIAARL